MSETNQEKKRRTRKAPKPKETMRESAAKTREKSARKPRVRKAASSAKETSSKIGTILTTEHYFKERKSEGNFFTKSRSLTPRYLRNAWNEVRQVTWPTRRETWRLMIAVGVFSVVIGSLIAGLDYVLERVLREVIL